MRLGTRIITTMAVAFLLAPTLLLCADDTAKSAATAKKDGAVKSQGAPGAVVRSKPDAAAQKSVPGMPNPPSFTPRYELFLGYSNFREWSSGGNRIGWLSGGSTSLAINANHYLGFVADFGAYHANSFGPFAPPIGAQVNAYGDVYTYMFGPRVSFRRERFTPFVQALFGGVHASDVTLNNCSGIGCTPLPFENSFTMAAGGGLDITLTRHFALRLPQVEYVMTDFKNPYSSTGGTQRQNDMRLSAGILFRFGGERPSPPPPPPPPPPVNPPPPTAPPPAARPPMMSCSADRSLMVVGERVQITATASSPDNNPLTYAWSTSGGQIIGSGSSVTFDSSGMTPGRYTVTGRVDDGRGGGADCSVDLNVEAAQASLPVVLEKVLALHSIYFPTAQPTVENPDGGLVPSQQAILRTLAGDFKKYLEFHPEAHLTLEGHADERASVEYNNALAERRVARSKSFLVEQGVPEADIETRSFGKSEQLDASQVREQMEANPDLTPEQRQKLFTNLQSIILAQNRRVDVVLTATGRKSVRKYPFNALDALTLLDDRQLEH